MPPLQVSQMFSISDTLGAEGNNCLSELAPRPLRAPAPPAGLGPASVTDITKPYPAKEPAPEARAREVSARTQAQRDWVTVCLSLLISKYCSENKKPSEHFRFVVDYVSAK